MALDDLFDFNKTKTDDVSPTLQQDMIEALRLAVISILFLLLAAFLLSGVLGPLFALGSVEETVTNVLTRLAVLALPYITYISAASVARRYAASDTLRALGLAFTSTILIFVIISVAHYALDYGAFAPRQSLQMTLSQTEAGIRVDDIVSEGAAAAAGIQVGDVITAIRRDAVDLGAFEKRLGQTKRAIRCVCVSRVAMKHCRRRSASFWRPTSS